MPIALANSSFIALSVLDSKLLPEVCSDLMVKGVSVWRVSGVSDISWSKRRNANYL